jgi:hypothetical protein
MPHKIIQGVNQSINFRKILKTYIKRHLLKKDNNKKKDKRKK